MSRTNSALTSSNSRIEPKTYTLCLPNLVKKFQLWYIPEHRQSFTSRSAEVIIGLLALQYTLQSEWHTRLQVVHRSIIRSILIICKFLSSWRQIFGKLLWFTSRMELLRIKKNSYDCSVIKSFWTRTTISEESFSSIKPHSEAGWEYACLSRKTK